MTAPAPGAPRRWSVAPYLLVPDVVAAGTWYRDVLGFTLDRFWGDPPAFTMVWRQGAILMLRQAPPGTTVQPNERVAPGEDCWDAYVWVPDADALHADFAARGALIVAPPCDQPYHSREFLLEDPHGYRLCFGHDLEGR